MKNHRKTIDGNGQTAKKHSMVMVSSKTIENLQWSLQNHWKLQWFPQNHWTCQWSSQINILLKEWNYPVVLWAVLQQNFLCKLYNINFTAQQTINSALKLAWQTSKSSLTIALKNLKTIEKPLKPMVGPSKNIQWWWSNVVKTIEKPLTSMVAWKKTLTIPSLRKIDHRYGLLGR